MSKETREPNLIRAASAGVAFGLAAVVLGTVAVDFLPYLYINDLISINPHIPPLYDYEFERVVWITIKNTLAALGAGYEAYQAKTKKTRRRKRSGISEFVKRHKNIAEYGSFVAGTVTGAVIGLRFPTPLPLPDFDRTMYPV